MGGDRYRIQRSHASCAQREKERRDQSAQSDRCCPDTNHPAQDETVREGTGGVRRTPARHREEEMARVNNGEPAGDVEDWADENKAQRARSRARDLGGPADATRRTLDTASAAAAKTDRDEEHERKRPSTHFGSGCRVRSAASRYSSRGRKMKRASGWLRRGGLSWHGVRSVGDSREPPELAATASFRLGVLLLIFYERVLAYDDALQSIPIQFCRADKRFPKAAGEARVGYDARSNSRRPWGRGRQERTRPRSRG